MSQIVQVYQPPIMVRVTDANGKECPIVVDDEEVNVGLLTLKSSHFLECALANRTMNGNFSVNVAQFDHSELLPYLLKMYKPMTFSFY